MANQTAEQRAAEAQAQEQSYVTWTVQQFSTTPVGEPYYALRAYDENGDVIQGFTGTCGEVNNLLATNKQLATELPAVTEAEYYRQAAGNCRPEEQRPAIAATGERGEWEPESFLARERHQIRDIQTAVAQIATEDLPMHEAYLSGRRDSYNALRDQLVTENPELAKSLPPSIEMDEIKVLQFAEQQKEDRSLEAAR